MGFVPAIIVINIITIEGFVVKREGWVFLKIPRGDIDGEGEAK